MNTREIAQSVGKDISTVQRWAKRASGKTPSIGSKMQSSNSTHPAEFNPDETYSIIEAGLGKNAAAIWRDNMNQRNIVTARSSGSSLTDKDIELISRVVSMTVSETIKRLDDRMAVIEDKVEARAALLPAPQIKPRDHINKIVREYAHAKGISFTDAWSRLYRDFGYRTNSNPSTAAKNRSMTIIDYIEAEGQIEILESVAMEIFK